MWYQNLNDRDYLSYEWVDWCLFLENAIHMDTCRSGTLVDWCLFGISCEHREGNAKQRSGHIKAFTVYTQSAKSSSAQPSQAQKAWQNKSKEDGSICNWQCAIYFFFYMSISNLIKQPKMGHISPPFFFLFNSKCQNMWRKEDLI